MISQTKTKPYSLAELVPSEEEVVHEQILIALTY
jgi:hypothetical protein